MIDASRRAVLSGLAALAAAPALGSGTSLPGDDLQQHDALALAALVRARKLSARELLTTAIARAEALDPRFSFMAQRLYEQAARQLSGQPAAGPFGGVPFLLKDLNTHIAGELTEGGSRLFKGYRASASSELVLRHQRAGLVIFGKTTSPEFGLTGTTENRLTGATRNPWAPDRIAGGSSGGAAVAVAAGIVPMAHATDGGGSIRLPASCCGLFGLKPSRGRVPMGPPRSEGWGGLSAHHVISRSVRDSAAMLDVTAGIEPGSRYGAPPPPPGGFLAAARRKPRALRLALMTRPFSGSPVDPQCVAAAEAAARLCEQLGHHVEIAAPAIDPAAIGMASFAIIASAVAADIEDRAKLLNITPGPDVLEPITLAFLAYGRSVTGRDLARANNTLQAAALTMAQFLTSHDMILSPTLAAPPLPLGQISLSPDCDFPTWGQRAAAFTPFAQIANLTGQPAMSVPLGSSRDGLPIGVMFTGRYGDEAGLLQLAMQLETAQPWAKRRPTL